MAQLSHDGLGHWALRQIAQAAPTRPEILREAHAVGPRPGRKMRYVLRALRGADLVVHDQVHGYRLTVSGRGALERLEAGQSVTIAGNKINGEIDAFRPVPSVRIFARPACA